MFEFGENDSQTFSTLVIFFFLVLNAHYWVSQVAGQQTEQRQERCYVAAARAEEKSPMVPNPNPKQY